MAEKYLRNASHLGELILRLPVKEPLELGKGRSLVITPSGSMVGRLGFEPGFLILESGYGVDCDDELRKAIVELTGNQFVQGDTHEVVDGVLLWWREGDSDLVDELVDVLAYLIENGSIWVLTPKAGRPRHVEPSDIQDAAPTAGLSQTSSFAIAPDWSATRMVARRIGKR